MIVDAQSKAGTIVDRILKLSAPVQTGEGRGVVLLFSSLFLIMLTAYLLKPVREVLILSQQGSEIRSYAVAIQAVVLLMIIPVYGIFTRKYEKLQLIWIINSFLAANLFIFFLLGIAGFKIAIIFFIWLGAYGVLVVAQFWAFASELYSKVAGERLFATIALGASTGAWFGAAISYRLSNILGPYEMILLAAFTLLASLLPTRSVIESIPDSARAISEEKTTELVSVLSSFSVVTKSRYLLALALFVIIYNWANSTGEYLLSRLVEMLFEQQTTSVSKEVFIGQFYSRFFLIVNILGFIIQAFIVSRVIKYAGVRVAFLFTPIIVFISYGFLSLFPIIMVFRVFKIFENSLDYSLQNTSKQVLYLPLTKREKYEGRAVIDTFCWRLGDMVQAAAIFIGLNWLHVHVTKFAYLNAVLGIILVCLAFYIGKLYTEMNTDPVNETD